MGGSASSRITLTRALLALGVLLVVINIGAGVWDVRNDLQRTELRARRDASNLTRLIAEQTASALEAVDLVLRDAVREGSASRIAAQTPHLRDEIVQLPQLNALIVLDAAGQVVGRTNDPPPLDTRLRERSYFTSHRDGRTAGLFLSEPYQAVSNGKWRFSLSRRIETPDGRFGGVVIASMELESFERFYRMVDVGDGGFISVFGADSTLMTRVPDAGLARGRKFPDPDVQAVLASEGRFTGWTVSPVTNETVLLSASVVRGFPLQIYAGATKASALASWRSEAWRIAVRTVLTSAAMLALIALAAWGLARRERALQRSERRFRAMIERSSDVELLHDPAGGVLYASPSLQRVLGYRPEEMVGKDVFQLLHADQVDEERALFAQLLDVPGKVATTEVQLRHKDGSWRWVENTRSNMLNEPSVNAVVMNLRDITERKLADTERGRLEQRLRQAEKMQAVGRLAGGIAHDFNNILGGILGYGEMLVEQTSPQSRLNRYAQNVLTAANRARGLVDQILAYSRSQRGKRVAVDLGRTVAETVDLVRGSLSESVHLETHLPSGPVPVIGDATQLHQVVMNVCTNALQAIERRGRLAVTLAVIDLPAARVFQHGSLAAGQYARLTVEDSGPGMDEPTLGRIFEPFFTTKEVGKGTGLGLSLVYGIVTDSGGAIDVTSEPGRGTAFTIYLPRVEAPIEPDQGESPLPRGHGELVLVVDDEQPLLAVTSEVLARLGYRPVTAPDSRTALAELESAAGRFDAVITDEVMPHLTGTQLAELLRARWPGVPVVLMSGYIGPMMTERAAAAGITAVLKKPVQARELAAALARALAEAKVRIAG